MAIWSYNFCNLLDFGIKMSGELKLALYQGNVEKLRQIFSKNDIVNDPIDRYGRRPIHIAVLLKNIELVRFLALEFGADVNTEDKCN